VPKQIKTCLKQTNYIIFSGYICKYIFRFVLLNRIDSWVNVLHHSKVAPIESLSKEHRKRSSFKTLPSNFSVDCIWFHFISQASHDRWQISCPYATLCRIKTQNEKQKEPAEKTSRNSIP